MPLMSTGLTIFEVGTTIGDYQIVSVIGRGGMRKVFKVRNLLSDRTEAMKDLAAGRRCASGSG